MPYLIQQNRIIAGDTIESRITAEDKYVIVIGGGDTAADCVGTAGAPGSKENNSIGIHSQILQRPSDRPWPMWSGTYRRSRSHDEAQAMTVLEELFETNTVDFIGNGHIEKIRVELVEWHNHKFQSKRRTRFVSPADLVLIAAGFVSAESYVIDAFGLELDQKGRIKTTSGMQSTDPKIFAAGDGCYGQSIVVRAIAMGRDAAQEMDVFLNRKKRFASIQSSS